MEFFNWLFNTRNGMFALILICLAIASLFTVFFELRTRKRFYNHEARKKGSRAKKAARDARRAKDKVSTTMKERNVAENGLLGGAVFGDDDDDDGEFDGLFSDLRKDLEDWDPDDDEEDFDFDDEIDDDDEDDEDDELDIDIDFKKIFGLDGDEKDSR